MWLSDPNESETRPTPADGPGPLGGTLIDSPDRAERIEIANEQAVARAESFLDETDFNSETVYLDSNRTEECFTLTLCRIA